MLSKQYIGMVGIPGGSFADPVEKGHYFASLDGLFSEEALTRVLDPGVPHFNSGI